MRHTGELMYHHELSPGTELVRHASNYVNNYIKAEQDRGTNLWKDLSAILSDTDEAGEGEQKMFAFINTNQMLSRNDVIAVCPQDNDVLGLALLTHLPNIFMYHKFYVSGPNPGARNLKIKEKCRNASYVVTHVRDLRQRIMRKMNIIYDGTPESVESAERQLTDFVFLCLFLGNDYLPSQEWKGLELLGTMLNHYHGHAGVYLTDFDQILENNVASLFLDVAAVELAQTRLASLQTLQESLDKLYGSGRYRDDVLNSYWNAIRCNWEQVTRGHGRWR